MTVRVEGELVDSAVDDPEVQTTTVRATAITVSKRKSKSEELTPEERRDIALSRPITMGEKTRIETLIETRANQLLSYLNEIQNEAVEASSTLPFTQADEIAKIKELIAANEMALTHQNELKATDMASVKRELEAEHSKRMQRIDQLKLAWTTRHQEKIAAAEEVVGSKFRKKSMDLTQAITKAKEDLTILERRSQSETRIRASALRGSFQQLSDDVRDQKNRATEALWTTVATTGDTKDVLAMLPDTVAFRRKVTPSSLFEIFNQMVDLKALPQDMKCPHCKSTKISAHSQGRMRCEACYKYFELDTELKKLLCLPTLADVIGKTE